MFPISKKAVLLRSYVEVFSRGNFSSPYKTKKRAIMSSQQDKDEDTAKRGTAAISLENSETQNTTKDIVLEGVREHNEKIIRPPSFSCTSISRYLKTRVTTLVVPKEEWKLHSLSDVFNPFGALSELSLKQWNFFFVGFWAWTLDSFDFFSVSLNADSIAKDLDTKVKNVTWGVTVVLMLRSVGSIAFGIWCDRSGRRWPYIVNLFLIIVIQIGTGFINTYKQFLAVRALFGLVMGGVYGTCYAIASEDCPPRARGIVSGMFQQGYAFGYLLAVVFTRALVDTTPKGWRSIFWFSAGPAAVFILWGFFTPETDTFLYQKSVLESGAGLKEKKNKVFIEQAKESLKRYWLMIIYCVLMMSGFNFLSHGSQDLYPTLLTKQYGFSSDRSTVTNSVANLGAIFGGIIGGHLSTFLGRRLTIILACIAGGALIYPWAFIRGSGINAGAFFFQASVQAAWGVVPIHLAELSPAQFKALVTGTSYQLGNLCSSASSTIEATIGESFPLHGSGNSGTYNYAKTMSIFMGSVFAYIIIVIFFGPENKGADMSIDRDMNVDASNKPLEKRSTISSEEKV